MTVPQRSVRPRSRSPLLDQDAARRRRSPRRDGVRRRGRPGRARAARRLEHLGDRSPLSLARPRDRRAAAARQADAGKRVNEARAP